MLAKRFDGVSEDAPDGGRATYAVLRSGGRFGFNALLGGGRIDEQYGRLEAHGFYWTASEDSPTSALFYNFGKGSRALHRQSGGDKGMAISVRCVRNHKAA
jgi:uncharacterized protein (TIGR02145 family)